MYRLLSVTLSFLLVLSLTTVSNPNKASAATTTITPKILSVSGSGVMSGDAMFDGNMNTYGQLQQRTSATFQLDRKVPKGSIITIGIAMYNSDFQQMNFNARLSSGGVAGVVTERSSVPSWNYVTGTTTADDDTITVDFLSSYSFGTAWLNTYEVNLSYEDATPPPSPTPDSSLELLQGLNNINSKIMIVNYNQAETISQSLVLPYSYSNASN